MRREAMGCAEPRQNPLHGRTLLFIDDDMALRRLVIRALAEAGAHCLAAATHDEAVGLAERHPDIDLAVLDFEMPDGDVAELARRLLAVRPGLQLVGTSGGDRRREFATRGIGRFLGKPWGPADLALLLGA
jgi:CheY-like chemotaxis protein